MRLWFLVTMILNLVFVTMGCAYRWGAPERILPGFFKQVSVPIFKNASKEPQIEVFFTNALIAELERSKVAAVVPREIAPAIIQGSILGVDILPSGRREGGDLPPGTILASQYRIVVRVKLEILNVVQKTTVWSTETQGERTYVAPQVTQPLVNSVNALYNHSARRIQIELLAQQMMSEAFALMLANF